MGHHGWQGNPPGTEDEARRRIVDAATACLDRAGLAKTSLSDVAAEAGVTRQTVYRYFPSLNDILRAVALAGVEEFAGRMERHLAAFGTAVEVAVESVVFAVRTLPGEPHLGLLLQAGEADFFTVGVISPLAFSTAQGFSATSRSTGRPSASPPMRTSRGWPKSSCACSCRTCSTPRHRR